MVNGSDNTAHLRGYRGEAGIVFPHFVTRVSGLPTGQVESLKAPKADALVDRLHYVNAALDQIRDLLSETLYEAVAAAEGNGKRRRLIKLRRDCYNLRPVDGAELQDLLPDLPGPAAEALEQYVHLFETQRAFLEELELEYDKETTATRRRFKRLLADEDFLKGLLISSRTLFNQRRRYLLADDAHLQGKEERIERGLLRYFTRAAMKATPFGAFCAVISGRFVESEAGRGRRFSEDPGRKHTYIRLNKSLFGIILAHLKERQAVRRALPVGCNPTLHLEEKTFTFLAEVEGRETFQRLEHNDALDLIMSLCRNDTVSLMSDLIGALVSHVDLDASEEEAEQYLDRLLEMGLLRFQTGIREQEINWVAPLCELLRPIEDERAHDVRVMLMAVQANARAYEDAASVNERAALLDVVQDRIRTLFEAWEINFPRLQEMPLYEDATADAAAELPCDHGLERMLYDLEDYIRLTKRLAWPRAEQATMRHFFDSFYGVQTDSVPLLQFYEEYYREHFKEYIEKRQAISKGKKEEAGDYNVGNPFELEYISGLQEAQKNIQALIVDRWQANAAVEEIALKLDDLKAALNDIPRETEACASVSTFVQLVSGEKGPARIIIPRGKYHIGFGKYFSRFLYLFQENIEEALRLANERLTGEMLAEVCGDANFNANFHPPLLPYEISYPTAESGGAVTQIFSSELEVFPGPDNGRLRLRHRQTGKEVAPVDLGFLNPRMRPPLYQLLAQFSPPANFSLPLPELPRLPKADENDMPENSGENSSSADSAKELSNITYRPRIVIENTLVVARKQWRVPDVLFPARLSGEADCSYFLRVGQWRREHGIPCEVYARIRPQRGRRGEKEKAKPDESLMEAKPETSNTENTPARTSTRANQESAEEQSGEERSARSDRTRFSRDYRKPQYIDFSSPLLVNLFGRMTGKLKWFVVILEERYPEDELLPNFGEAAYTTETILQLNFSDERAESAAAGIGEVAYAGT